MAGKQLAADCAVLADMALKEAAKEVGKSVAKWGIPLGGLTLLSQAEQVQSVGNALLDFAAKLAGSG
jgi:hypothetical protein